MNERERQIWDEIVKISYKGVLGEGDRIALELMCRLVYDFRYSPDDFNAAKYAQLSNLLGRFGLTPSDRTKIVIPKGEDQNPFEQL